MKSTPALGPAPTRPDTAATAPIDAGRARVLSAVREASAAGRGATIAELTGRLGGHPNTVRHHVSALVTAGLVEVDAPAEHPRRGRPAVRYRSTAVSDGFPVAGGGMVEEYVALAAAFAERLAEQGGDPGGDARSIGRAWGSALLARDTGLHANSDPCGRVVGVLHRLGFSPAVETSSPEAHVARPAGQHSDVPDHASGGTEPPPETVLLRTCPLLESARRHPEVVCQVHSGLVEGLLGAAGPGGAPRPERDGDGAHVDLRPFARPGACELTISV